MIRFSGIVYLLLLVIITADAQSKVSIYRDVALRFAGDAEMAFIGPAASLGGGIEVNNWTFGLSYTYFVSNYRVIDHRLTFQMHTADVMIHYRFPALLNPDKGFFLGAGICWQYRLESVSSVPFEISNYPTGAYTLGYRFPVNKNKNKQILAAEWKAFGPLSEVNYLEVFTQFMIGVRLIY